MPPNLRRPLRLPRPDHRHHINPRPQPNLSPAHLLLPHQPPNRPHQRLPLPVPNRSLRRHIRIRPPRPHLDKNHIAPIQRNNVNLPLPMHPIPRNNFHPLLPQKPRRRNLPPIPQRHRLQPKPLRHPARPSQLLPSRCSSHDQQLIRASQSPEEKSHGASVSVAPSRYRNTVQISTTASVIGPEAIRGLSRSL